MFEDFGLIEARYDTSALEQTGLDLEEKATEDAIQFGAEEVEVVDAKSGSVNVSKRKTSARSILSNPFYSQFICTPTHLNGLSKTLSQNGYSIENSEHMFTPNVRGFSLRILQSF